ncbi:flagellar protein FlaG [Terribacillus aidingensis]|uniref:Flagellar protein FlaG n=1 Tax=Terribacillus aidingensis TaxID=586416 RepID=A0A285N6W6_9BACI|nr:flagellar protein FlaG [Terribacillus aidingensis]SNZ05170.1 flagellar protein FlaG [Terribacillus aidingensis]
MIEKLPSASQHVIQPSGNKNPAAAENVHKQDNVSEESNPYIDYDKADIEKVIEKMNQFLEPTHTNMKFELHEELERYYVTVVDSETKEVVKEIPPKKLLDAYAKMAEFMGILVDEKI